MALFEALEEDRVLKEVMRCRAVEIKGDMPQAQKDYYNAMKRRYALPLPEQEERTAVCPCHSTDGGWQGG